MISTCRNIYSRATDSVKRYVKPEAIDLFPLDQMEDYVGGAFFLAGVGLVSSASYFLSRSWTSILRETSQQETVNQEVLKPVLITTLGLQMAGMTLMFLARRGASVITNLVTSRIKKAVESKIHSIAEHSKKNTHSMLALRTTSDHNGAFSTSTQIKAYQHFGKTHSIDLIQEETKPAIQSSMTSNHKKYDIVMIEGHSNPKIIHLSENCFLTKYSKKTIAWIRDRVKPGGFIIIQGCSTGKGSDNIARAISRACPEIRVYASRKPIDGLTGVKYNDLCEPIFMRPTVLPNGSTENRDTTRIYVNGNIQPQRVSTK